MSISSMKKNYSICIFEIKYLDSQDPLRQGMILPGEQLLYLLDL